MSRTMTTSRESHSNMASATRAAGDASYPAVVASSALAMREGVLRMPSRDVSSPRHCSAQNRAARTDEGREEAELGERATSLARCGVQLLPSLPPT